MLIVEFLKLKKKIKVIERWVTEIRRTKSVKTLK